MADNALINTLLLAEREEVASSFRRALDSISNLFVSNTTDAAINYLSDAPFELIISTPDFASSTGIHFFEEIMPQFPDPVRIMIAEKEGLESVIEAINKGQIYKYVLRPWTDDQISTIVREASDFYHMRTSLDDRVNQFNEQLIQAELNLEALIQDIQMNETLSVSEKFDLITRLKSTITLLESPEYLQNKFNA